MCSFADLNNWIDWKKKLWDEVNSDRPDNYDLIDVPAEHDCADDDGRVDLWELWDDSSYFGAPGCTGWVDLADWNNYINPPF